MYNTHAYPHANSRTHSYAPPPMYSPHAHIHTPTLLYKWPTQHVHPTCPFTYIHPTPTPYTTTYPHPHPHTHTINTHKAGVALVEQPGAGFVTDFFGPEILKSVFRRSNARVFVCQPSAQLAWMYTDNLIQQLNSNLFLRLANMNYPKNLCFNQYQQLCW